MVSKERQQLLVDVRIRVRTLLFNSPHLTQYKKRIRIRSPTILWHSSGCDLAVHTLLDCCLHVAKGNTQLVDTNSCLEFILSSFLEHCIARPPSIDQRPLHLCTWNLTSLKSDLFSQGWKLGDLRALSDNRIVALQETKLTAEDCARLQLALPLCQVIASPAAVLDTPSDQGQSSNADACEQPKGVPLRDPTNCNLSGGVALVLPTYYFGVSHETFVVAQSYGVAAFVQSRGHKLLLLSVYFPPGKEKQILGKIVAFLKKQTQRNLVVLMGDVNQCRKKNEWDSFLAEFDLVDLSLSGSGYTPTYRCHEGFSALDVICCSASLTGELGWTTKISANFPARCTTGHAVLSALLSPPRQIGKQCDSYQRLPNEVFKQTHSASKLAEPMLRSLSAKFFPDWQCPVSRLRLLNAFVEAFAKTFPVRSASSVSLSYLFKRKLQTKSTVILEHSIIAALELQTGLVVDTSSLCASGNGLIVPRPALLHWLSVLDHQKAMQHSVSHLYTIRAQLLGRSPSVKVFEKYKLLAAKATGSLCRIQTAAGIVTDPSQVAEAVRVGREFWVQEPSHLDDSLRNGLSVADLPDFVSDVPAPSLLDFQRAIACSPDTSPGLDGIPYAAYRMCSTLTADTLASFLERIAGSGVNFPTKQLLVWIPKASAGDSPDNWRPLSMPLVFDRLIDKTVFAVITPWFKAMLHHSQSLISELKDAQFNYLCAQQHLKHGNARPLALLIDLAKAFERVDLSWLCHLLAHYNAPLWFQKYCKWTWHARSTTTKVMNHLSPAFHPTVGLDMGRACSVLLFCLSVDPLYRKISALSLPIQRAYMDDTTFVSAGTTWISVVQDLFSQYHRVGVVVEKHSCCSFHPCLSGVASWLEAANLALECPALAEVTVFTVLCGESMLDHFDVARSEVSNLANGIDRSLLCRLVNIPCTCKAKTSIIPSMMLSVEEIASIDATPYGAKILKEQDISLGLPIHSQQTPVFPTDVNGNVNTPKKVKEKTVGEAHLRKTFSKIKSKQSCISNTITSIPKRAQFWSVYCQSCLHYIGPVLGFTKSQLQKIRQLQSRLVLGRSWIQAEHLPSVFHHTKIYSMRDPSLTLGKSI